MHQPLVLGISCHFHDAAAALVQGGTILAAVEEERLSRRKHDAGFPEASIAYCLSQAPGGRRPDAVVFYEDPALKLDRILASYADEYPGGGADFRDAMRSFVPKVRAIPGLVAAALGSETPVLTMGHHAAHAASAFLPSPFEAAAIMVIDGVGEWSTCSTGVGEGSHFTLDRELRYPHSLGMLYSAFTQYCGFKVNSGEYKLMGLAPFGTPRFAKLLRDQVVAIADDGSFQLDMQCFAFNVGRRMFTDRLVGLLGRPPREPESRLDPFYADVAASIQAVTEEIVLALAANLRRTTGMRQLCMAGGVALNCVANGRLARAGLFDHVWVQPAAGDAGGALGAALAVAMARGGTRQFSRFGAQGSSCFGPEFSDAAIARALDQVGLTYRRYGAPEVRMGELARSLADGMVAGRFHGRLEFGPRALGNRSIIADPRRTDMQRKINLKIKFRESWRPFAPAVLAEHAESVFEIGNLDPYMLFVGDVRDRLAPDADGAVGDDLIARVQQVRSALPAITHVDYSARVQCVHREINPGFWSLIEAFHARTGCPVLVNTSFNVRGEPIVCTPEDAIRCFLCTDIDVLEIGSFLVFKADNLELAKAERKELAHVLD